MNLCSLCCNQKATYVLFLCYNMCSFRRFHKEILVVRLRLSHRRLLTGTVVPCRASRRVFIAMYVEKKYVRICRLSHVASRSI